MYGKEDIENIIVEYERALRSSKDPFSEDQVRSLKTAFGMGITQALLLIERRIEAAPSSIRTMK
ncbi:MAG: hypothetical protein QCI82_05260 [Candidatus Thermoplasmatota archaeon]|nr:hypothetical protein [Candidatus Thermoplasmatota archaeon]